MTSLLSDGATTAPAQASARDAMAARMYPPPAPAPQPTSPTAEVTAVRAADPARAMYPPEKQFGSSLDELVTAVAPEGDATQFADLRVELGHIIADARFDRSDLAHMAALVRQRTAKPLTSDEAAAERRESIAQLRQVYRDPRAFDEALSAAKKLIQTDSRLHAFVQRAGFDANPWFVLRAAELGLARR